MSQTESVKANMKCSEELKYETKALSYKSQNIVMNNLVKQSLDETNLVTNFNYILPKRVIVKKEQVETKLYTSKNVEYQSHKVIVDQDMLKPLTQLLYNKYKEQYGDYKFYSKNTEITVPVKFKVNDEATIDVVTVKPTINNSTKVINLIFSYRL